MYLCWVSSVSLTLIVILEVSSTGDYLTIPSEGLGENSVRKMLTEQAR